MIKIKHIGTLQSKFCPVIAVGVLIICGSAEALADSPTLSPRAKNAAAARFETYYNWFDSSWTDNDTPFATIRSEIDRKLVAGVKAIDLEKQYGSVLKRNPADPKTIFAYYYATYQVGRNDASNESYNKLAELYATVIKTPPPHTYNFARLVFLCATYTLPWPRDKDLGYRLIKKDPDDYDVRYSTALSLVWATSADDLSLALKDSEDLQRLFPNRPTNYYLLGVVHRGLWKCTEKPEEATEAVDNFKKYLSLDQNNARLRQHAQRAINELQKR